MYRGLVASGGILGVFGLFLVVTDLFVPLGVSIFGLPLLVIGVIMSVLGYYREEPTPIAAEPGSKFCWYCMKQIPTTSRECPHCSLPQHDRDE